MLLERQSWSLAIKSFQSCQKYEGITRISKDSGMQTFLKTTFLYAAGSCSLIPPHHQRRKSSFASCSLLCHRHHTHFFTDTWASEINTCHPSTDYTEQGETKKTTQINESWKKEHIYLLVSLIWQEQPLACSGWYYMQLHNIYQLASMSIAFTYIQGFDILNLRSHQTSHSEDKFFEAQNTEMAVPGRENIVFNHYGI